ncbi:MAG: 50S ribosomal protein L40e [Thermoproteota archaeon]|nr:50S ribosomal protein L40e [Candidatus Brockarchaeota archaeon]MBO3768318.1 50S ribosomal protein L40e [Candidatus Brockarchaeota archaeon]MBO3800998.1 50S ribosomal protein L40e [Candidatus Brockarchaeota archaeon]
MPLADPSLIQLAQRRRLYFKICRKCGAKNSITAVKCRKCRSFNLRLKKRMLKAKKSK